MKLAIGLILSKQFPSPTLFWDSYEQLVWRLASGEINQYLPAHLQITATRRIKSGGFPVDVGRNEVCRGFLEGSEDYLLFLDADMTFPVDLIDRLLVHEQPVITARYHVKEPPFHACVFVKHRTVDGPHKYQAVHVGNGVIEIERCGAGALLIRRDVIARIQERSGDNWFRYQRTSDPPYEMTVSEDFWFCQQAREAGFRIYCDWDVECGHLAMIPVTRAWNTPAMAAEMGRFATMTAADQQRFMDHLVVRGLPEGFEIAPGRVVPEYQVTTGER